MPSLASYLAFAAVSLGMALTPGPNMVYLVSRSIAQGRTAGLISLGGILAGHIVYMVCAAVGLTALLIAIPYAYDTVRLAGALYLLYLAWQAVRPNGRSPFQVHDLPKDSPRKLFAMGLLTNLLNPKIAVLYLSLLPQFIDPESGSVLAQALIFCGTQLAVSVGMNAVFVVSAGTIAAFFTRRPLWSVIQRWLMGTVLASLAVRMATEAHR
ncbi:LysE family translocator [Methylobacterium sp. J-026]|uniref:LysE family translocator n=1 Tax=Methylobacterium sp. J-026 TaxID=2836624 RepID=UPI001FB91AE0|nr:LysE family translocator [Methylobacterium sp. J-026]MCJ2138312.1 LysE family translocator [Methylobacterium sp. J-026]